jgi:4'-phosphopantetheinyl transferase EntD
MSQIQVQTGSSSGTTCCRVGTTTHCEPWAIAAVASNESREALGIDLEDAQAEPLKEIAGLICSDSKKEWVFASGDHRLKLVMIFSAKEVIYKARYPR